MSTEKWIPEGLPMDKPTAARIYDYMLGGYHNFEIDRQAAEKVLELYPDARLSCQASRAFLRRVVTFLTDCGIDQFLDIGAGIPTVGNTHGVAQQANPAARIVYVDIDPVAVAHGRAMLRDNPGATAIQADARRPSEILNHPEVQALVDLDRPVGVLLLLVLHSIRDDEVAYNAVTNLRDALVPGSYIVISHGTRDNVPPNVIEQFERLSERTPTHARYRSREAVLAFFAGLELVDPGLVLVPLWRPEERDDLLVDRPERSLTYGGVGRTLDLGDEIAGV
jgi:SAM-dependent methyltransferase